MKGYVYIISNQAMPGIFKIGFTLKDPELRAKELDSTGVPYPFIVEYEILVDEPYTLEQHVHKALRSQREGKEWFRCDFSQAVQTIHSCYQGRIYYEQCFKEEREAELEQARIEQELLEQMLRQEEQRKKEEEARRLIQERRRQEEERRQAERTRQIAEERQRAQELAQIRKKAAEEEEQRKQAYISKRKNGIFVPKIIILFFISIFIGLHYSSTSLFVLSSFISLIISASLSEIIFKIYSTKWINEYKTISATNEKENYPPIVKDKIHQDNIRIVTCPRCGKRLRVGNLPHMRIHCPLCLFDFTIRIDIDATNQHNTNSPKIIQHSSPISFESNNHDTFELNCPKCGKKIKSNKNGVIRISCPGCNNIVYISNYKNINKKKLSTGTPADFTVISSNRNQQYDFIDINCPKCNEVLSVGNAQLIRVSCPKCFQKFYCRQA